MKIAPLIRYHFRLLRKEQLWAPVGLLLFFTIAAVFLRGGPDRAALFQGTLALVPLIVAALAPSLLVDDPVFELRSATPFPIWRYVTARATGTFLVSICLAGALWLVAIALNIAGPFAGLGWVTIVPAIALASLSSVVVGVTGMSSLAIAVSAAVWVFQVFYGDLLLITQTGKLFHLYLGVKIGLIPAFWANHFALGTLGVALYAMTTLLFKREERFLP